MQEQLLPPLWNWPTHGLYLLALWGAGRRAPWRQLREPEMLHLFLGACVGLMVVWTIRAGLSPGLSFHYLGATLFTLMFGPELAFIGLSLVLLGTTLNLGAPPGALAVQALTRALLPVLFTQLVLRLVQARLPRHLFVYVFVNAFFASALAVLVGALALAAVLGLAGVYTSHHLVSDYLAFVPLMMFGEAWVTGMLVAVLVGYRPRWLWTFDDRLYLHGK
jgi:uncharacterized membrane protein